MYQDEYGLLYDGDTLVGHARDVLEFAEIKKGTKIIAEKAMWGMEIGKLVFPGSVEEVKESKPENAYRRTEWPFWRSKVDELEFEEGTESICANAFNGAKIKSVKFPASLKTIGEWAFAGCSFTECKLNDGLEAIYEGAFCECRIKEVTIPASVKLVRPFAFYCTMKKFKILGDVPPKGMVELVSHLDYPAVVFEMHGEKAAVPVKFADGIFDGLSKAWDKGEVGIGDLHHAYEFAKGEHIREDTALLELTLNQWNQDAKLYVKFAAEKMSKRYAKDDDWGRQLDLIRAGVVSKEKMLKLAKKAPDDTAVAYILETVKGMEGKNGLKI